MNDLFLQHYILTNELKISVRKSEYFTFHLSRCIKFEDKIRLTIFIASQIAYTTSILISLNNLAKELNGLFIPKVKEHNGIKYITCNQ